MARKIKAKTLSKLVVRYLDGFPDEATEAVAASEPADGAELVGLLPEDRAWRLLRLLPANVAREWLEHCSEDALARLIHQAKPDAPADQDLPALTEQARAILVE